MIPYKQRSIIDLDLGFGFGLELGLGIFYKPGLQVKDRIRSY